MKCQIEETIKLLFSESAVEIDEEVSDAIAHDGEQMDVMRVVSLGQEMLTIILSRINSVSAGVRE